MKTTLLLQNGCRHPAPERQLLERLRLLATRPQRVRQVLDQTQSAVQQIREQPLAA